ncbi:MAG: 3-hydroxyacyl-CoA dehydrogenase NAD-binding domain-containing protein [Gammaproteobacteria bacterium]|nr:3-hydroxyacyl-CoA dehydrogenase NAD-binding domain-containing protein [Gammaproteobacteria bacterium]MDE0512349.1 3-hydroxyacyl-CoA dehydrogenase NAD-binding domain-containing protein [Gammaproteobacteria bacterium]
MPATVSYEVTDGIAVITIDNPPVNAMSAAVRKGCWEALDRLAADDSARAAVLICAGRTFIAGADITEFDKPIVDPWLPDVVEKFEASEKLVVAAIHGTALGGGLETAMGCHYRCALPTARVGLPEVHLGLLPGATGTQRLPRLAGARKALDMMTSGRQVGAAEALESGIVERLVEGDLRAGAIAYARELLDGGAPLKRVSQLEIHDAADMDDEFYSSFEQQLARKARGFFAPFRILECVRAAVNESYSDAFRTERRLFDECKASTHSQAQRHLFFAEREVAKIPDVPKTTPVREINSVAVIGAGTMGGGIAMNFVNAGMPVTVLEVDRAGLERGLGVIRKNYGAAVDKGRMTEAQLEQAMGMITPTTDYADLAGADLVIEAVFENMDIKKQVFTRLDEVCKQGAILASNTSSLDLNEIATVTGRPQDVIGMHFFAPANIMKLLEVVRGEQTAADVIATAMAIAKKIRKVGVLVGVCFGFVGNRMFFPYIREAQMMMLEGIPPERVDQVAFDWGMAMGPHAVMDLSGLDVFYKLNNERRDRPDDPVYCRMINVLTEMGRLGQKTGAGTFRYEGRKAVPDPEVMELARREAQALGVRQIEVSDEEIVERLLFSMVNEGARVLEEGIAIRPGDIDVIFVNGYGMPRYRGGPMKYADMAGLDNVLAAVEKYRARYGDLWWTPAPLLEQLARAGSSFREWNENR